MKRLFLLAIGLCFVLITNAATVDNATVNTTAGNLYTDLVAKVGLSAAGSTTPNGVRNLTITGTLNATDFTVLVNNYTLKEALITLDLSGVTGFAAYSGTGGPNSYGSSISYPAGEFPAYGLYQFTNLTKVVLPEGGALTSIGQYAFAGCTKLTTLNIPSSVTNLGDYAFYSTALNFTTLPSGILTMGKGVFAGTSITAFTWPDKVSAIPDATFSFCSKLASITVPKTVTSIGQFAFQYTGLSSFQFPEQLAFLGASAFDGSSLTGDIVLPSGLQKMDAYGTFNGTGITSIQIPDQVKLVRVFSGKENPNYAGQMVNTFSNCANLVKANIPSTARVLGGTFGNCSKLGDISIPEGVTALKDNNWDTYTFGGTALTKVVIPSTVTDLGISTFSNIPTLRSVTIGKNVATIGNSVFSGDTGLQSIVALSDFPVNLSTVTDVFLGVDQAKAVLYVPNSNAVAAYKQADGWKAFANIRVVGSDAKIQTLAGLSSGIIAHMGVASQKTITLPANTDQGLPVTYTIENGKTGVATLGNNVLTIVGEGAAQVTATQAGDNLNWSPFSLTFTLKVVDYSYLKAATIAVEGDTMRVAGPGAGAYTKLYVNGTASTNGDLSKTNGTVNLKATDANATKLLKLTVTHQASAAASAGSKNAAASNNAAGRAAAERSLRDAVNNSFVNPRKH